MTPLDPEVTPVPPAATPGARGRRRPSRPGPPPPSPSTSTRTTAAGRRCSCSPALLALVALLALALRRCSAGSAGASGALAGVRARVARGGVPGRRDVGRLRRLDPRREVIRGCGSVAGMRDVLHSVRTEADTHTTRTPASPSLPARQADRLGRSSRSWSSRPRRPLSEPKPAPARRSACGVCSPSPACIRSRPSSGRSRDARIGSVFEQTDVEFPTTWSQNATNIVAQKYFRGQLDSPTRERSVKQMVSRVAGTIADWGRQRGYFASVEDGDAFEAELTYILLHQLAAFNSPVWFNVGLRGEPAVLGLLHPLRRRHDGVDPRLEHQGGQDLPRRFRLRDQPVEHPRVDGAADQGRHRLRPGLVHARRRRVGRHDQVRRQDAPRGEDGRARRRPPGHPRVHLVQGQGGGQGRRAARRRLRHVDRRRRLPVDPVPERQQLGPAHGRVHARGRERRRVAA